MILYETPVTFVIDLGISFFDKPMTFIFWKFVNWEKSW